MKFNVKELRSLLKWYGIASDNPRMGDADEDLFEKIRYVLDEKEEINNDEEVVEEIETDEPLDNLDDEDF